MGESNARRRKAKRKYAKIYAVSCTRAKSFLTEEEEEVVVVSPKVSRGGKSHEARHDTRSDLIVRAD